ncbi:hypothetical protein [Nocardioides hwasunensis]|uniref:Polysaccharide chain length determinant N-terminal domain-containing protein n=1 Tax=Nocardioides hwasunensis TaxID=397258 RepID=A0ABR8MJI3_9ACTN|nr:hypothetical protein [Nocardioides hwasunensis]MBD3915231.1 hypothetical protein [Nocardioides hwasunensis]
MYLIDALSVLVRRWYVVLAGMVVLAAGAAAVITYVPTTYQSTGQMLFLLPPTASGTERPVNPYLNLQDGLTTAASLVAGAASTKDVEKEMKAEGLDAEYAIAVVPGTGPLITVTAKDSNAELATETRDAMMTWIDRELRRIQDEVDVPQTQYISAIRSSVSRSAEALPGSKLRALAALLAVVGLLTLIATFGLDRLLLRRAARRAGRRDALGEDDLDDVDPTGAEHDDAVTHAGSHSATPAASPGAEVGHGHERPGAVGPDGLVLDFHPRRQPAPAERTGKRNRPRPGRGPRVGSGR